MVTIGSQTWLVENLKTTKFRDGSQVPLITDQSAWAALTTPGFCWYDNNTANKSVYGGLYNGYAVRDSRGLCPTGWHVVTDADFIDLETSSGLLQSQAYFDGDRGVAGNVGGHLISTQYWDAPNSGADNSSGFTAIGTGYRRPTGEFNWFRLWTGYYTSTAPDANHLIRRYIGYYFTGISRSSYDLDYGYSIRCVKD
ncbi:MAG: fibrobacter succinogenes major paralogous domain-containing protein [Bacteroidales bacterium]|jgi:uncharacterized protein (TIGR02145 family)|nr:fibrobacter succinogenes major paralogous domain-containing protein [Bacteroidales bacterium]